MKTNLEVNKRAYIVALTSVSERESIVCGQHSVRNRLRQLQCNVLVKCVESMLRDLIMNQISTLFRYTEVNCMRPAQYCPGA